MGVTRAVTFPSGAITLEGLLHLPDHSPLTPLPGIAVCHPHPLYGGDMHNNVVSAVCETANDLGVAALRFNFRGAGASEGRFDNGIGEQEDARAALDYLRGLPEVDGERVALAGYSFGAAVAVRAAVPDLSCLIAVSLPTTMPLEGVLLSCPALFVSGDEDEYSDAAKLEEFVRGLGQGAELVLLPGLGHFWFGVEHELSKIVSPFLKAHLAATATV